MGQADPPPSSGRSLNGFKRRDFEPRANFPDVPDANLPERWPIAYDDFLPFYRRAEKLLRVRGTDDPLNPDPDTQWLPPPPMSDRDQALNGSLVDLGLHPYRSHVGFHHLEPCFECFDVCKKDCKGDAGGRALVPALVEHGAKILTECEAEVIESDGSQVRGVRVVQDGRTFTVKGKVIVLATGAFMTPKLLLNSAGADAPDGLANSSGMVGRNLMLHTSDFLTIDHREMHSPEGPMKSISLNDFYFHNGRKLGTLQAVGLPIIAPLVLDYLRFAEVRDPRWWRPKVSNLLPTVAKVASKWFQARRALRHHC